MKRILLLIVCFSPLLLTFNSCDQIEAPYINTNVDTSSSTPQSQKVLLEDYTGHKCGNCPRATKSAYDLKAIYGDRLIILAIHAGFFAGTNVPPFTYDFKCAEGIQLDTDFGVSAAGNPNGMVNRKQVSGSYIVDYLDWGTQVNSILASNSTAPAAIEIETVYNSSTRNLEATIHTEFLTSLSGTYNLTVFLAEDSIINWQKDYDVTPNDIPNYVHREVLRGSMNGTYGTALPSSSTGDTLTSVFNSTLDAAWDENHISVIAFITDGATKEVIQVEQVEVEL
jgi:hypothetical protein